MFTRKDPLKLLSKEEIISKLATPGLSDIKIAWINKKSVIDKITNAGINEQQRLIHLVKRYLDYTERAEMSSLIKDKLDNTSLTGLSVVNFYDSCRNPTEDKLKDAVALYKDLQKEGFLDATEIQGEKDQFIGVLIATIREYRKSPLVGNKDKEKNQFIDDILTLILARSITDAERQRNARELRAKLMSSKSWYLNDVKIMFSRACIICDGLSNDDALLSLGNVFDNDLKATTFTRIVGFVLAGLTWCGNGLSSCLDFMSQGVGSIETWAESEDQCIDRLIEKQHTHAKSGEQEVLQQLYQARQIMKVQQGQQSCYQMYTNLHQRRYLISKHTSYLLDPAKTKIKPSTLDADDNVLENCETSDVSPVYLNMHNLHDIMSYIKLNYVDKNNSDPGLKKIFLALESEFKKIKLDGTTENLISFQLGDLEKNKPVFKNIQRLLGEIKPKLSARYAITTVASKLEYEIDQLKKTMSCPLTNQKFANNAKKYINEHFDTKERLLQLSKPSPAGDADENTSLMSSVKSGFMGWRG